MTRLERELLAGVLERTGAIITHDDAMRMSRVLATSIDLELIYDIKSEEGEQGLRGLKTALVEDFAARLEEVLFPEQREPADGA